MIAGELIVKHSDPAKVTCTWRSARCRAVGTWRPRYTLLLNRWAFSCQTFTVPRLMVPKVVPKRPEMAHKGRLKAVCSFVHGGTCCCSQKGADPLRRRAAGAALGSRGWSVGRVGVNRARVRLERRGAPDRATAPRARRGRPTANAGRRPTRNRSTHSRHALSRGFTHAETRPTQRNAQRTAHAIAACQRSELAVR